MFLHTTRSKACAEKVVNVLWPFLNNARSFLDLGCGVGSWSAALEQKGINHFVMVDHPALQKEALLVRQKDIFQPVNLDTDLPAPGRYDLALCIEVLEHFTAERALEIFHFLSSQSDLVLFSAAVPGQHGKGHINCRRHAYWHQQFAAQGFDYYDGFKPQLFGMEDVHYWIQQNLFLYYRPSKANLFEGLQNITHPDLELVHQHILQRKMGIWEYLKMAPKVFRKEQTWG